MGVLFNFISLCFINWILIGHLLSDIDDADANDVEDDDDDNINNNKKIKKNPQ